MSTTAAFTIDQLRQKLGNDHYKKIPEHLRAGIMKYLVYRCRPGSGLASIIEDCNAANVVARCDDDTLGALRLIVQFFQGYVPGYIHGNREAVDRWVSGETPMPSNWEDVVSRVAAADEP